MKYLKPFVVLVCWITLSHSVSAEIDWKAASVHFIDDTVVPAYGQFIEASQGLMDASDEYCQAEAEAGAASDALIKAYHQAADAWQGIQIYRSGPAQLFNRHSRIQTWPGISKIIAKQIRQLLAVEEDAALEDMIFRKSSTALQGFPALERVLFANEVLQAQSYACRFTQTIARNLRVMGEEMQSEWGGTHKRQILTAGEADSYLTSAEDVAAELLTDFYTQVYSIGDQKLGRPYAKSRFRFKRAESWRSQRSLRNIRVNIESAEAYYKSLFMPMMESSETNKNMLELFTKAKQIGAQLGDDFATADEQHAEQIVNWRETIERLRKLIQLQMPGELGLTIGFNSLDGDG